MCTVVRQDTFHPNVKMFLIFHHVTQLCAITEGVLFVWRLDILQKIANLVTLAGNTKQETYFDV